MNERTCTVPACDKPTRSGRADLCKMHYHRQYRHGSVDITATRTQITASLGRRYKRQTVPGHPLADRNGRAYVHRVVLYDTIGPGPHPCHWCETPTDWLPKGSPGELHTDHLNGDGADNRPENLVPACRRCNSLRGTQAKADALREAGWWSNHDTIANLGSGRTARIQRAA